jgi:hypothetical protein
MINDTISVIEERLRHSASLNESQRADLLQLLGRLKTEIGQLSKTHQEQAESITSFADVSARESMRQTKNPQLIQHSIHGLKTSVAEFEHSHPDLAGLVNRLATMLSNMGI